ncbi:hypothetical protein [Streptomyces sp. NBC_01373]|uniref:hypothetical protein n=1 Tax=Streptomyces sp. NBC_01373 TaxID=2903843 RepID=UPI002258107D|nr:hypothetical protein [Streptomyces sp. NBC_01373]MCX4704363.1 hypothetical protein [Streptomyces sp. NBC_01373]MCX4707103.1 hypothetical protein [Streptomyces sp. NBC_01373]
MSFLIASGHVEVEAKTDKALSAITGLVGALGAVGPVAGVAAAGLASAGAGVAAFGLAAAKQVVDLKNATQAQNKYEDAVAKSGKGSAQAAKAQLEYQRTLSTMPRATREAAAAWAVLTDEYKEWSDSLADDTMPVFTKSFGLFQAMLPKTSGLVRGTSAELDRFLTLVAGEVASPGFDRIMNDFTEFAVGSLRFGLDGILELSRAVADFGAGGGFDDFIDTAKAVGPVLGETLANLAEAVINLAAAGGDLGIGMLTAVNALAELVNAVPPGALSTMLQLYAAMKLLSIGMAAMSTVAASGAVARLAAYFAVMRVAGVAPTLRATAASMTAMQKAGIGLGVLAIAAIGIDKLADKARGAPPDVDRLTTSLKNLAQTGKFSGELQKTFGDLDGLVEKVKKLQTETDKAKSTAFGIRVPVLDDVADWIANKTNDMAKGSESLTALKEDFQSLDQAMAGMVGSGHAAQATQDFNTMRDALKAEGLSIKEINALFPQYGDSVAALKAEQQLAAQGMGLFGQQAIETKAQLDAQKASADGLRQSIMALNDTNRAAYDSQIQFEQGIDALTASFKEHGATLDIDTAAGQANGQAMSSAAKSHDEMLAASIAAGESLGSMTGKSEKLRSTMMRLAVDAFDGNKAKAQEYVNTLLGTPDSITTVVKAERKEAVAGLQAVQAEIQKTPGAKSVTVTTLNAAAIKALEAVGYKTKTLPDGSTEVFTKNGQAIGSIGAVSKALANLNGRTATTWTFHKVQTQYSYSGKPPSSGKSAHDLVGATGGRFTGSSFRTHYDTGGRVVGPGTGTSDDVFAPWLSNGEWVINAAAVQKYGDSFLAMVNDGTLKLGPHMAKGGKLTAKQKAAADAEKQRQKEGRSALTGDVTLSTAGKMAGFKNNEMMHNLGMPDSVNSLAGAINKYLSDIKKAFTGKQESQLVSQMMKSGKALLDNQKKLEAVNKKLDSAKDKLEDLKGKFDQLKTSVSSSLVSFGNITKIGKYGTSPETLIKQLQSDTGRTTEFAGMLEQLKGKGLNAQSISEIAQAGVAGGGMATAQSLLNATPEQIKQINELEAQLKKSADKAGTVTADAMYGAGVRAAEGLVKGLTKQQGAIEAAMMSIAKSMEAAIKKALGIKSPAKVMEPIGDFAFQGVEQGWVKRAAAGSTLLSGSAAGLRVRPALMTGASSAATPGGAPVNITVNIHSTDLMTSTAERKRVAGALVKDLNDELLAYQKQRRR